MQKIDYKKEYKECYRATGEKPFVADIPAMNFLMIDGRGDPQKEKTYQQAIEALYSVSYTLKFIIKKSDLAIDYSVMPLEGLWWADDMTAFTENRRDEWQWTLMIMQPDLVSEKLVKQAVSEVESKKDPVALDKMKFQIFDEGRCAAILHIGPFSEEGPTIKKLHSFMATLNLEAAGRHHEIYLSDMRRSAPEKWKTIIRQPVKLKDQPV